MNETPADAGRQYAPRLKIFVFGGLLVAALVAAFVSLGRWQWHKYSAKVVLQAELDELSRAAPVALPPDLTQADAVRMRRVVVAGEFDAAHQFLVDNRIDQATERAGYHVVTPLRIAGSQTLVLVNRGWIPAAADRRLPEGIAPPTGHVELTGIAVVPPSRFFMLASPPASGWQTVWQNLDLARFAASVRVPVQPVVVQLDAVAPHGFARNWPRPDERAEQHLSYALQWFGFAASTVMIWLYFLLRRS